MPTQQTAAGRPLVRGDVVLAMFPFTDLSAAKRRPAIVVAVDNVQSDITMVFVSSQNITSVQAGDIAIMQTHSEFTLTGLSVASKIRVSKLATVSRNLVTRWLGRLGPVLISSLDNGLATSLGINLVPYREEGRRVERNRLATLFSSGGFEALSSDLSLTP